MKHFLESNDSVAWFSAIKKMSTWPLWRRAVKKRAQRTFASTSQGQAGCYNAGQPKTTMRRLLCILLMFCLPLQSFAMQWSTAMETDGMSLTHEALHDEHVSHHHEDDGSIHFDNSDESSQHIGDHYCSLQPAVLCLAAALPAPLELVEDLRVVWDRSVPDPELKLPDRPPSHALG
jgi:hypothetical protein